MSTHAVIEQSRNGIFSIKTSFIVPPYAIPAWGRVVENAHARRRASRISYERYYISEANHTGACHEIKPTLHLRQKMPEFL